MYLEYIVIAMSIIILYLIYYVFSKDSEYNKNIHAIASVVEELNRELYYLKNTTKDITDSDSSINDEIYQEIEKSVYDMVQPLSVGLKKMQENIQALDTQMDSRISSLEVGVKQILMPSSLNSSDDDKIISLFNDGFSIEEISKELHISKPEVEFALKINRIK
jgi:uncharacterized protein YoxC